MINKEFLKSLGPGLMWAGAAVGVSHLVQSTRAGANYGFYLVGILILANVLKYPFFEFAPRYAAATGKNLISGYNKVGKWAIWLYAIFTFGTMFTVQAAVTFVTAGLLESIFRIESINTATLSLILLVGTMIILLIGKFSVLDKIIKVIIIILTLSTIVAVISAVSQGYNPNPDFAKTFDWNLAADIAFVVAFVGWMPAPIDVSIWHSYWSVEKQKDTGYRPTLKEALLDFKIGYIGTAFLAIGFLSLGALVMYGTSKEGFPGSAGAFSSKLIELYTSSIGSWAYPVIALAAFTTMFSTTLTCLDAYSKVLKPTTEYIVPSIKGKNNNWLVWFWLLLVVSGALLLIYNYLSDLKKLIDIATTMSFVTAPVLAFLNYKAVTSDEISEAYQPKKGLRIYAIIGLVFLTLFSLAFLYWRIFIK